MGGNSGEKVSACEQGTGHPKKPARSPGNLQSGIPAPFPTNRVYIDIFLGHVQSRIRKIMALNATFRFDVL